MGAHGIPTSGAALLFAGAVAWQFVASVLFWRAWVALRRGRSATGEEVTQAFVLSLALWAAFLIATEVTVNYTTAGTHKGTLIAQLATLLVVRLAGAPREMVESHGRRDHLVAPGSGRGEYDHS